MAKSLSARLAGTKWAWCDNGHQRNGDIEFKSDGSTKDTWYKPGSKWKSINNCWVVVENIGGAGETQLFFNEKLTGFLAAGGTRAAAHGQRGYILSASDGKTFNFKSPDEAEAPTKVPPTAVHIEAPLSWGATAPHIELSEGNSLATDTAKNPTTGDDGKGRYRVAICETGFNSGKHSWKIRIEKPGRFLVGVVTGKVEPNWREGAKLALHEVSDAWTICVPSKSDAVYRWHESKSEKTSLPCPAQGSLIQILLDCDAGQLTFIIDDHEDVIGNLPKGEKLFPAVSFGGDDVRGCSLRLVGQEEPNVPPKQESDTEEWEKHVGKDILMGQDHSTMCAKDLEKCKQECIRRNCNVFVTAKT